MSHPTLTHLPELLDALDVALCVFDDDDRAVLWNRTFLRFFPEHDGFVYSGEHYRENLRRFYEGRLSAAEMPLLDDHIAQGIIRHRTQTRSFAFEHRGRRFRVSTCLLPGIGRARLWTDVGAPAEAPTGADATSVAGARVEHAADNVPEGVAQVDEQGRITSFNHGFSLLYGLLPSQLKSGATFEQVLSDTWENEAGAASRSRFVAEELPHLREAMRFAGAPFEVPLPGDRWVRVVEKVDPDGRRRSVHFDITLLKREQARLRAAEAKAREREAHLKAVIEHAPTGMAIVDPAGCILEENLAFRRTLGVAAATLAGAALASCVHEDDAAAYGTAIAAAMAGAPEIDLEIRFRRSDDATIWGRVSFARLLRADASPSVLVQMEDITARREAEAEIAHMARHDALTGLPNRTLFNERLARRLRDLAPGGDACAVLCLDLDHFKAVNDTLGHLSGDVLLRELAARFRSALGPDDTIARLGGDEFVVLLCKADGSRVEDIAARLIALAQEPVLLDTRSVQIGLSVGIAQAPNDGTDAERLFGSADLALYRAKEQGRNTFCSYSPQMDEAALAKRRMALDLRLALQRGELSLHYQAIVATHDRTVVGYEALARWIHPERGSVPPAIFIALAEEIGLIDRLGEWVLRQACRDACLFAPSTRMAVNVSAAQVRTGSVLPAVRAALAASGLPACRLELEITESVLMGDGSVAADLIAALRTMGVRLALDDFGTGYSSLSYLRRFHFDKIKIDRAFIADIENPDTAAIVRAVVSIGRQLGATITAEGFETEDQFAAVSREGCEEAQGYLIGRPQPLRGPNAQMSDRTKPEAA